MTQTFPFSAVVGMDDMGLALCLSAVSPAIGGVLVRGEKGTAKSTMVRALASVLPPVSVVAGDRFSCDPTAPDPDCPDAASHAAGGAQTRPVRLVELPVGASEDRVVGSLHLDRLLTSGRVEFDPGLLAQAHRGVLYVDEVNLLPDHLVDTLLDSAAMGRARIEREGVSVTHAARFVLVGTMNPEEGELRPQLLDRFGLAVDVTASRDPRVRVEVVRRRMAFEDNPARFRETYAAAETSLASRISAAQDRLSAVVLGDEAIERIAAICAAFDVDGMRGDLVTARTAVAHAAWSGREAVSDEDIRVAARLALPHRKRRNPFDDGADHDLEDILDETVPEQPEPPEAPDPTDPEGGPSGDDPGDGPRDGGPDDGGSHDEGPPQEAPADQHPAPGAAEEAPAGAGPATARPGGTTGERAGSAYQARLLTLPTAGTGVAGRRSTADTATGRHVRAVAPDDPRGQGISLTGTVLSAASRVVAGRVAGDPLGLHPGDLRRSVRRGKEGNLVVFVVDTSGSMGARQRIREVKTACVSLLLDAYQRRDKVAVLTFAGKRADLVLPPTTSVELAERLLAQVPTGGRTPLAEGLTAAYELVRRERAKDSHRRALLVVLTDGRASSGGRQAIPRAHRVADGIAHAGIAAVVVDCEESRAGFRLGLARDLAQHLGAEHLDLRQLAAEQLSGAIRQRTRAGSTETRNPRSVA
ncbi:magnesium chelatase subunit D family protein [Arsenicicoccus sp. oral taxon 190]|uniref:magnesium chelatase subunit D family protein n=1 Tax=Arsenicicoccus sp. oral taxon 190 TaxID=1658671 RepID=UPI0020A0BACC|nr:magnesium chelatase subunit D family protein [Arsenicicoccus sp. oral taxon 190]